MSTTLKVRKALRRSEAVAAFEAARDDLTVLWRNDVRIWLAQLPAEVRAQLGGHPPIGSEIDRFALNEFTCSACVETRGYDCSCCATPDEMYAFPCPTLRDAGIEFPRLPTPYTLRDFWDEPVLTVVLNHYTTVKPYDRSHPGEYLSVPWSHADAMKAALRTESRQLIERYR